MDTTKKLSIAKLDFVQVCGLSLNFYNNTLRKFLQIQRQSKDLNKSNFAIGWLTNQQTISLASSALKSVLSWSISIIQNPWHNSYTVRWTAVLRSGEAWSKACGVPCSIKFSLNHFLWTLYVNTAFLRCVASGYCDERAGIKIYCTVL